MNNPNNIQTADLLIELGCEELPPKSLPKLASTFYNGFLAELKKAELVFDQGSSRLEVIEDGLVGVRPSLSREHG